MKISSNIMALAMVNDEIQIEKHERVPFFKIKESDSYDELGGKLVDNYYTVKLDNQLYVKMASNSKNTNGVFDGSEPTYNNNVDMQVQKLWITLLGDSNLVSPTDFQELVSANNKETEEK